MRHTAKSVLLAVAFVLVALLAALAFGGTTLTVNSETWELRDADSHTISKGHPTREACETAGKATPNKYRCIGAVAFTVVGFCEPSTPPAPKVDADGATNLGDYAPQACANEHYSFTQTQFVRDPYPSCAWVEKPVQVTDCDGKAVNPMIQGSTSTAQLNEYEPREWTEGLDYPWGAPCPAEAPMGCYSSPLVSAPTPPT